MNQQLTPPLAQRPRSAWPRVVALVAVVAILIGGAAFITRKVVDAPVKVAEQGVQMIKEGGRQLRSIAEAFNQGTVRTEFLSHATEVHGSTRLQFATLKQNEVFKREENGATAWGWVPLPRVVVQAQAPVEYNYTVDLAAGWELERDGDTLRIFVPPIEVNAPAVDVSALTFYTLEGSIWRDETAVRDRLQKGLTVALKGRAVDNERLVRETGRKRLTEFVEKWLATKFSDGQRVHVKIVFPDERLTNTTAGNRAL